MECKYAYVPLEFAPTTRINVCTHKSGSNLTCSMNFVDPYPTGGAPLYRTRWTMKLQRFSGGEEWATIGTRTGYVDPESPSTRTFTGIKSTSRRVRVFIQFHDVRTPYFHTTHTYLF